MDSGVDEILRTRPARPSSGRAKGILSGLGIGHRLALALAIPAVALIVLTAVGVGRGWQAREKAVEVGDLALVLSGIGAVVHEVQKERGLSAGFVASRGTRFAAELRAQREASDQALAALDSTIAQAFRRRPDSGPVAHLALFKAHAGDIPETRARLDLFAMSDANVIDFYSTVLSQALLAGRTWSAAAGGTALNGPIWAHLELIEGKEHAGQERAIGNAMLSGSSFGGLFPRQFIELGVEQVAHFRTFQELAGAGFAADLDTIERGPAGTEIQRLRAAIGGLAGTSGVRPEAWHEAATRRIDQIRDLELGLAGWIGGTARDAAAAATRALLLHLALLGAVLALMSAAAAAIVRGITTPVGRLARAMEGLTRGENPVEPVGGDRGDEIGAMVRAFEVLRDGEAKVRLLAQIVEQAPVGIVITDSAARIVYVNPAITRLSGRSHEELLGENPRVFSSGEPAKGEYERLWRTLGGGHAWEGEILNRRKDGGLIWEHEMIAPVLDRSGSVTHYVAVKEDITSRKKVEEHLHGARLAAEAANESKTSFLANMSHELRTPLNAIIGFSEMLKTGVLGPMGNPKQAEYVADVHKSGRYLLELINDILDLSKIESGAHDIHEQKIRPAEAVETAMRMVRERAGRKAIMLRAHIADDAPCLLADERMLKQILLNLMTNAIKFTPEGGKISVHVGVNKDAGTLDFRVTDTGIGITPEDMDRVFRPFGRIETDPYVRGQEGTGLGLALSRRMARLHGGDLSLESTPGAGTVVTVRFPKVRLVDPNPPRGLEQAKTR